MDEERSAALLVVNEMGNRVYTGKFFMKCLNVFIQEKSRKCGWIFSLYRYFLIKAKFCN